MNIGKILNFIADNNIDPEKVFELVERIQTMDLKDESSLRKIIKEVSNIAGKKIDKSTEDSLIKKILEDGVNEDIFDMF